MKDSIKVLLIGALVIASVFLASCKTENSEDSSYISDGYESYEEEYDEEMYTLGEALKTDEYKLWYKFSFGLETQVSKDQSVEYVYVFNKNKNEATIYYYDSDNSVDGSNASTNNGGGAIAPLGNILEYSDEEILQRLEDDKALTKVTLPYEIHLYTDSTGNEVESEKIIFKNKNNKFDMIFEKEVYGVVYDCACKGVGQSSHTEADGTMKEVVTRTYNESPFIFDDIGAEGVIVD